MVNCDFCFRTYGYRNDPPNTPIITGELNGDIRTLFGYTIQTTDPDQNDIQYYIDWGDNTNSGWIGPYDSGQTVNASIVGFQRGTILSK